MKGLSSLVTGLALAVLLLAAAGTVTYYLRSQEEWVASSTKFSAPSVSAYAFKNSTSYTVVIYNYGSEPRENAKVSYYALDGSIEHYNLLRVDPGECIVAELPGRPLAYIDGGGAVFIRVVNEG